MSQIIENRADIDGMVEDVTESDSGDVTLHVRLHAARPVDNFANLLTDDVGDVIAIRVAGAGRAPTPGTFVSCRVRKAGIDRFFADAGSLRTT